MKEERNIEKILSNLKVRSDENARQAAFERMMSRRAELLAANSESSRDRQDKEKSKRVPSLLFKQPKAPSEDTGANMRPFGGELSCEELAMAAGGVQKEENGLTCQKTSIDTVVGGSHGTKQ